jgi:hypothetical protein
MRFALETLVYSLFVAVCFGGWFIGYALVRSPL